MHVLILWYNETLMHVCDQCLHAYCIVFHSVILRLRLLAYLHILYIHIIIIILYGACMHSYSYPELHARAPSRMCRLYIDLNALYSQSRLVSASW